MRKINIISFLLFSFLIGNFCCPSTVFAITEPQLLKDIRPGNNGTPTFLTTLGDQLIFQANDEVNGGELWVSDGTEAGTEMLKDIYVGSTPSNPSNMTFFDDKVVFTANDGVTGTELWITDGTELGTELLKDISPGSQYKSSYPYYFTVFDNKLYFQANDGTNGIELWVTDGTTSGTQMLKDINPGSSSSSPSYFTVSNNKLYFQANDGTNGIELWVTDGTEIGTTMVKDINPSGNSSPYRFAALGTKIYFAATDGTNGSELWVSDGTEIGTTMVKDIYSGSNSSNPNDLTLLDNKLYFQATDGTNGAELWATDGTEVGTTIVKDIYSGSGHSSPNYLTVLNDKIYFAAADYYYGNELWATDGTEEGTEMVANIRTGTGPSNPVRLTGFKNKLYFVSTNGTNGNELWTTDGTEAGTSMVKDIYVGASSSTPDNFTVLDNKLFFTAYDATYNGEIWFTTASDSKELNSFNFSSLGVTGIVNSTEHTVSLSVPNSTVLTSLVPTINLPEDASVSPLSGVAQDFTNPVTYTVTAEDDSTQDYVVTVTKLASTQTIPDSSGSATLSSSANELLVSSSDQELNIEVEDDSSNPIINVSSLVASASAILPKTTVTTSKAVVSIPETTTITSSNSSWTGEIKVPTVTSVNLPTESGQTSTVSKALILGSTDSNLTFDKGVRVVLTGDAGKLVSYSHDGITFTEITDVCSEDSQTEGDALADGSECKIDVGDDLVVWTKHFTTFVTYTLGNSSSSSSSSSRDSDNSCSGSKPVSAPDLFQIDVSANSARLYFTPISNTNEFVISFSTNENAEQFGETVELSKEGVQAHHVYELQPNTTYYFKVRGQKGCMPGDWSNIVRIRTLSGGSSYSNSFYKNQTQVSNYSSNDFVVEKVEKDLSEEEELFEINKNVDTEVKELYSQKEEKQSETVQQEPIVQIQEDNFFNRVIDFVKNIFK